MSSVINSFYLWITTLYLIYIQWSSYFNMSQSRSLWSSNGVLNSSLCLFLSFFSLGGFGFSISISNVSFAFLPFYCYGCLPPFFGSPLSVSSSSSGSSSILLNLPFAQFFFFNSFCLLAYSFRIFSSSSFLPLACFRLRDSNSLRGS